jgi:transcriptional regulator with XRE-family HTH domain
LQYGNTDATLALDPAEGALMDGKVDVGRLHKALDGQRTARSLSWRQLAHEAKVSPSLLSRMGNGLRPDLDGFVALVQWLGTPAEHFMVNEEEPELSTPQQELESEFAVLLRARNDLTDIDKKHLQEIVEVTMRRVRADRQER